MTSNVFIKNIKREVAIEPRSQAPLNRTLRTGKTAVDSTLGDSLKRVILAQTSLLVWCTEMTRLVKASTNMTNETRCLSPNKTRVKS